MLNGNICCINDRKFTRFGLWGSKNFKLSQKYSARIAIPHFEHSDWMFFSFWTNIFFFKFVDAPKIMFKISISMKQVLRKISINAILIEMIERNDTLKEPVSDIGSYVSQILWKSDERPFKNWNRQSFDHIYSICCLFTEWKEMLYKLDTP